MNNPKKLSEALALKVIKELVKEALSEVEARETGADVFGDALATPMPDETDDEPSLDVDDNEFNMRAAQAFNDGVLAPKEKNARPRKM